MLLIVMACWTNSYNRSQTAEKGSFFRWLSWRRQSDEVYYNYITSPLHLEAMYKYNLKVAKVFKQAALLLT